MKKINKVVIITLILLSLVSILSGCELPFTFKYEDTTATITNKQFVSGGVLFLGEIMMPEDDSYYVYLQSDSITTKINDKRLYDKVQKGDKIPAYIEKEYNKKNELTNQRLVLSKPNEK